MTKEEGFVLLKEVVDKDIKHRDYDRVTHLADLYYKMKTGDGLTDELRRMVTRETNEEFEQRKIISKSVIPSTLNSTMLPFQKAIRKSPLLREILYESKDKKKELEEYIGKFWGEKSLEEYLEFAIVEYNYTDPNAFLITEFDPFDADVQKASPYPFVATSKEAIMFEYKNETLQYLIVKLPIKFLDYEEVKDEHGMMVKRDVISDGNKFTLYLGADTVQFRQVGKKGYGITLAEEEEVIEINSNYYLVQYFEPKASKVPAVRFGYLRDTETRYRTMVSVFHPVILLLEKMMKTDSELDLSTALTAFPQRLAYVDSCPNKECLGGKLLDGHTCTVCNGTGKQPLHNGVMDVITFTMPRTPQDVINLDQMLVYKFPPLELLDFNKQYIADLRALVHSMMFNNEIFSKTEVTATATEKILDTDNMNDTLYPFARNYSSIWEFVVIDIATFTDAAEGLSVHHKYPNDFKFKPLTELMSELKSARDAGASSTTVAAIEDDINEILYSDRPADMKMIKVKSAINPFRGYDEGSVRLLISQNKTTQFNAVLYANLESIFNDLELEDPDIYNKPFKTIKEKVTLKTEEYLAKIEAEKPEPVQTPFQ